MEPLTVVGGTGAPSIARSEVFWIETLSRHHDVLSRQRCLASELRIGRGYDNDVILDDPHVAANHLSIRRGPDGRLVVEDLGSRGGLYISKAQEPVRRAVIDGHTLLRIGSTLLRVRTSDHVVEPERPLTGNQGLWPQALALVATVSGLTLLNLWWEDFDEPQVSHYATRLLLLLTVGMVWTTMWAVVSRVFGGAMRYGRHLAIAFGGLLALSLYESATQAGAYALANGTFLRYTYVGSWLLFGGACLLHLFAISPRHPVLKSASVVLMVALAIGGETLSQGDMRRMMGASSVARHLEPPAFRLKSPSSTGQFFADNARLQVPLDKARTQEQPPIGPDGFDSDNDD